MIKKMLEIIGRFVPMATASTRQERVYSIIIRPSIQQIHNKQMKFFSFGAIAPIGPWPTSMKLSVSLRFSRY
jgi:hypothetical protein